MLSICALPGLSNHPLAAIAEAAPTRRIRNRSMHNGVLTARQEGSVTSTVLESSQIFQAISVTSVEVMNPGDSSTLEDVASKDCTVHRYEVPGPKVLLERSQRKCASEGLAECSKHKTGSGKSRSGKTLKVELPPLPRIDHINLYPSPSRSAHGQETSKSLHDVWSLTKQNTHSHPKLYSAHSWPPSSPVGDLPFKDPFGACLPLTPPQEVDSFGWPDLQSTPLPPRNQSLSSEQGSSVPVITGQQQQSTTGRPSIISLPDSISMDDQDTSPSTWLERAVNTIGNPASPF